MSKVPLSRSERPAFRVVLGLLALAIATRFPFWFTYVIDWDESTFILLGNEVLEGALPLTTLWDIKGPLGVWGFAAMLLSLGQSVTGVRVGGALLVWASALLLYLLAALSGKSVRTGVLAATMLIVGIAATPSGQATMMELVALPPLLAGTLLVVARPRHRSAFVAAGALVGAAALVRMNLSYAVLAVVVTPLVVHRRDGMPTRAGVECSVMAGVGVLLALSVAALPYVLAGESNTFLDIVFTGPLAHVDNAGPLFESLYSAVRNILGVSRTTSSDSPEVWVGLGISLPGLISAIVMLVAAGSGRLRAGEWLVPTSLIAASVALSIAGSGISYPHHGIQLLPFLCFFAAVAFDHIPRSSTRLVAFGGVAMVLLGTLQGVGREYHALYERVSHKGTWLTGTAGDIAAEIRRRCGSECTAFVYGDHLVYWIARIRPPTRIAHPSNIFRASTYVGQVGVAPSPREELESIFAGRPRYVVARDLSPVVGDAALLRSLDAIVCANYELVAEFGDQRLLERSDSSGDTTRRRRFEQCEGARGAAVGVGTGVSRAASP